MIGNPSLGFPARVAHPRSAQSGRLFRRAGYGRAAFRLVGSAEGGGPFDIAIHISGGQIVIEAEPGDEEHGDATGTVRAMMAASRCSARSPGLLPRGRAPGAGAARLRPRDGLQIRRGTARAKWSPRPARPGIGSFKGLRYPASDIPKQARELYKRNLLRVIHDVNSTPVGIIPELERAPRNLWTSRCRCCVPSRPFTSNI